MAAGPTTTAAATALVARQRNHRSQRADGDTTRHPDDDGTGTTALPARQRRWRPGRRSDMTATRHDTTRHDTTRHDTTCDHNHDHRATRGALALGARSTRRFFLLAPLFPPPMMTWHDTTREVYFFFPSNPWHDMTLPLPPLYRAMLASQLCPRCMLALAGVTPTRLRAWIQGCIPIEFWFWFWRGWLAEGRRGGPGRSWCGEVRLKCKRAMSWCTNTSRAQRLQIRWTVNIPVAAGPPRLPYWRALQLLPLFYWFSACAWQMPSTTQTQ